MDEFTDPALMVYKTGNFADLRLSREAQLSLPLRGDTLIGTLLRIYPQTGQVLQNHGIFCCCCMGAADETIANAAILHDLEETLLLQELNDALRAQKLKEGNA